MTRIDDAPLPPARFRLSRVTQQSQDFDSACLIGTLLRFRDIKNEYVVVVKFPIRLQCLVVTTCVGLFELVLPILELYFLANTKDFCKIYFQRRKTHRR